MLSALHQSLRVIAIAGTPSGRHYGTTHNNPNLPSWLQDSWAGTGTTTFLQTNWRMSQNVITISLFYDVTDMMNHERCDGVSDRFKPIPLILLAAARSQRIFFIQWYQRLYPLEEFLVPPHGGFNWSVPDFLVWWKTCCNRNGVPSLQQVYS
jgi:hypothetical protein